MSDLSPDGEHLVYYARNESKHRQERAKAELRVSRFWSWTAVCKPPWVKALGLWNASDLFSGGGVFIASDELWLHHDARSLEQVETLRQPVGLRVALHPQGVHQAIWIEAMKRTGWRVLQMPEARGWYTFNPPLVLRKKKLELSVLGRHKRQGGFVSEYRWHGSASTPLPDLSGATWADLDQQGRLVYAREGRIYVQGAEGERELFNLNADQPPTSSLTLSP